MNLSQEPSRAKLLAAHDAFVLKDTGIKKKYYFIKSHSTASLALVTNVFFSEKPVSFWRTEADALFTANQQDFSMLLEAFFKLLKQEL